MSRFVVNGLTRENFSTHIRDFVVRYRTTYIEALSEMVAANNLEPEDVKSILSEDIMFQIKQEAYAANMLKRTSNNKITFE